MAIGIGFAPSAIGTADSTQTHRAILFNTSWRTNLFMTQRIGNAPGLRAKGCEADSGVMNRSHTHAPCPWQGGQSNRLSSADGPYKAGTFASSKRKYTVICPRWCAQ